MAEDHHLITISSIKALVDPGPQPTQCGERDPKTSDQNRQRLCYKCRKPGHEARNCHRPNLRQRPEPEHLSEKANRPVLSEKQPAKTLTMVSKPVEVGRVQPWSPQP